MNKFELELKLNPPMVRDVDGFEWAYQLYVPSQFSALTLPQIKINKISSRDKFHLCINALATLSFFINKSSLTIFLLWTYYSPTKKTKLNLKPITLNSNQAQITLIRVSYPPP